MSMYVVAVEGLPQLAGPEAISDDIKLMAARAINYSAKRSRTESSRRMREEVNFPAGYLTGDNGRLTISVPAVPGLLQAKITGRFTPTSLSRFVKGSRAPGKAGVTVQIEPGHAVRLKRAFMLRLPQGRTYNGETYNEMVAVRLQKGETLRNKIRAVQSKNGLHFLFGPSVDQVFRTVAEAVSPQAQEWMEQEFLRLWEQRDKGNIF